MARHSDSAAATETLHEIESVFDRLAQWVVNNPTRFLIGLGLILATTAAVGLMNWLRVRGEQSASAAVAQVRSDYLRALGAPAGSLEVVEPANPETVRNVRVEYIQKFLEAATAHEGSAAALSARLEAGNLQAKQGDAEAARATLALGAAKAPAGALEALALQRLGHALEDTGEWREAAARHRDASRIDGYPLRLMALGDAARCYAEAGETDQALAIFAEIEAEGSVAQLPTHVQARLRELRTARELTGAPAAPKSPEAAADPS